VNLFLGSGTVLINILKEQARGNLQIKNGVYVSDFNKDLINFFKIIQRAPNEFFYTFVRDLTLPYNSLENEGDKLRFFHDVRSNFNSNLGTSSVAQSSRFLFLNKTCYGGLFRTNSAGFFNVPFGYRKKPRFLTESSLINISKLIRNVNFSHKAFDDQMINYERGDFFYLDPPYVKMKKTSFVNYLPGGFSNDDFIKLLNFCKELDDQDCFFTISNSVSPKVFAFARDFKTLQHSTNSLRGYNMNQLLITNSCNKLV
jgi:DNA adenine methylase